RLGAAKRIVGNPFAERQRFIFPDLVVQNPIDLGRLSRATDVEIRRFLGIKTKRREELQNSKDNRFSHSTRLRPIYRITLRVQRQICSADALRAMPPDRFASRSLDKTYHLAARWSGTEGTSGMPIASK